MGLGKIRRTLSTPKVNPEEYISRRDYPLIKRTIVKHSQAENWEDAAREWIYISIIEEDSQDFSDHCQICNASGLRRNFQIFNPFTSVSLLVGKNCIRRFIKLNGTENIEDTSILLKMKEEEHTATKVLLNLLPSILDVPTIHEIAKFRRFAEKIIPANQEDITPEKWNSFLGLLLANSTATRQSAERIKQVLWNPRAIKTKQVRLSNAREQERIGSWGVNMHVKTRITTTLTKSEAYSDPKKKQI